MTTGRINQVAADVTSLKMKLVRVRVSDETRLRWFQVGRASLFGSLLPILFVEQNASSHGFRTCLYHATRRRQGPSELLALCGPRRIVRFAAPASSFSFIRSAKIGQSLRETPDVRPQSIQSPELSVRLVRWPVGPNSRV